MCLELFRHFSDDDALASLFTPPRRISTDSTRYKREETVTCIEKKKFGLKDPPPPVVGHPPGGERWGPPRKFHQSYFSGPPMSTSMGRLLNESDQLTNEPSTAALRDAIHS